MKNITSKFGLLFLAGFMLTSCNDFNEINIDPKAANIDQVQVEYFLNGSIIDAQQDPHVAERAFVLYWKTAGHQQRGNGISTGVADDGWSSDYYGGGYLSKWLNSANMAISTAQSQIEAGTSKPYTQNSMQAARIWRAYLMSELTDNFGPIPVDGFQGVNPEFSDVKTAYYFMLQELKEATAAIDESITVPDNIQKLDPAYAYNYGKWKKFGNSLRLRFAMRLSEVDAAKAKTEFEDAAAQGLITTSADVFAVQEKGGWDPLSGVMSREWNGQQLSATLNNLYIGLGGIPTSQQVRPALQAYIKPENYMGIRYEDHFTTITNDPSAGFWFDGLHSIMDPRSYKQFIITGDFDDPNFSSYPSYAPDARITKRNLLNPNGDGSTWKEIEAKYTWNAFANGAWGNKGALNQVYTYIGTNPRMSQRFRGSTEKRIFFAEWETYFLLAEGAVRGWATPVTGKEAYESGIKASLAYFGVDQFASEYLSSRSYNRAGTSVSWEHTVEPAATRPVKYINGANGQEVNGTFTYPSNTLYKNGAVKNDLLTKIITQKFIAQTPWLPLETWNDHRRLGLPFFENPAVEIPIVTLPALTRGNYMTSSNKFFPQRLKYPSSLSASNPAGYKKAVELLGGADDVFTPLWWAKQ